MRKELQSEDTCLVHIGTTYWKSASGTCTMNKADLSIAEAGDSRFKDGRNRRAGLAIRQILRNTRSLLLLPHVGIFLRTLVLG